MPTAKSLFLQSLTLRYIYRSVIMTMTWLETCGKSYRHTTVVHLIHYLCGNRFQERVMHHHFQAIDMFMSSCTFFVFLSLIEYAFVNVMMGDISEIERKDRGAHMKNLVNHHKFLKNVNICGSNQVYSDKRWMCTRGKSAIFNWLPMNIWYKIVPGPSERVWSWKKNLGNQIICIWYFKFELKI